MIGNAARWPTSDLRTLLDNYGTSENAAIVESPILLCAFCKLLLDRSLSAFSPLLLTGSANKEKTNQRQIIKLEVGAESNKKSKESICHFFFEYS